MNIFEIPNLRLYVALYWFGYEYLRSQKKDPTLQHMFLSGCTSGAVIIFYELLFASNI
jgi:hypothetical protein